MPQMKRISLLTIFWVFIMRIGIYSYVYVRRTYIQCKSKIRWNFEVRISEINGYYIQKLPIGSFYSGPNKEYERLAAEFAPRMGRQRFWANAAGHVVVCCVCLSWLCVKSVCILVVFVWVLCVLCIMRVWFICVCVVYLHSKLSHVKLFKFLNL